MFNKRILIVVKYQIATPYMLQSLLLKYQATSSWLEQKKQWEEVFFSFISWGAVYWICYAIDTTLC